MWRVLISGEVRRRLDRLQLPFNPYGLDPWGVSRDHLGLFYSFLERLYRDYFRVTAYGIEHVPEHGRAMVIGNHSGSLPVDGGMVLASLFLEPDTPRHAHGMVEKFAQYWPFVSEWFMRVGQLPGLPEHATRLLEDERMLMVFPEGARGTGKLYKDRYKLVRFGSGFMRIALQTKSPIVPLAFIGGEEALPAVYHAKLLAKLTGAPYWPVPRWVLPIPKPVACQIYYSEPMRFEGTGHEGDEDIDEMVVQVRDRVRALIRHGLEQRKRPPGERQGFALTGRPPSTARTEEAT
jgi:1-acyl-sn-glycerol-3-phosphate acyltransferase